MSYFDTFFKTKFFHWSFSAFRTYASSKHLKSNFQKQCIFTKFENRAHENKIGSNFPSIICKNVAILKSQPLNILELFFNAIDANLIFLLFFTKIESALSNQLSCVPWNKHLYTLIRTRHIPFKKRTYLPIHIRINKSGNIL